MYYTNSFFEYNFKAQASDWSEESSAVTDKRDLSRISEKSFYILKEVFLFNLLLQLKFLLSSISASRYLR